jgi:hypothetical protein
MFDNLREASEQPDIFAEGPMAGRQAPRRPAPRFLGMTAGQRLLLSILLLGAVILMGVMCLVVTGRVYL